MSRQNQGIILCSYSIGIFQRIEIKFSQPHFQPNFSYKTTSVARTVKNIQSHYLIKNYNRQVLKTLILNQTIFLPQRQKSRTKDTINNLCVPSSPLWLQVLSLWSNKILEVPNKVIRLLFGESIRLLRLFRQKIRLKMRL
jgi:hypothetical protein